MDNKVFLVFLFVINGLALINCSTIVQRPNAEDFTHDSETESADTEKVTKNKNTKRQFVFYPHGEGYGHHHHHHHDYHEGFFDGGEHMSMHGDQYADHGGMDDYEEPHEYEHVHHQYKHIHHVSEYRFIHVSELHAFVNKQAWLGISQLDITLS